MDDKTSSRIRDLILDAGRRQRPPQPDAAAVRRRMLASTLRLAAHTVSQNAIALARPGATTQPEGALPPDAAPADDKTQTDISVQAYGTAQPDNAALPDNAVTGGRLAIDGSVPAKFETSLAKPKARVPKLHFDDHAAGQISADSVDPEATTPPDAAAPIDDDLQIEDETQLDDELQIEDAVPPGDAVPPDDVADDDAVLSDDAAQLDEDDASGDLLLLGDPALPIDLDSDSSADDPTLNVEPAYEGPAGVWTDAQSTPPSSGLPLSAAAGSVGMMPVADSLADDVLSVSAEVLEGDSALLQRPQRARHRPLSSSPGAGSLSGPTSECGDCDGGGHGNDSVGSPEGPAVPDAQPPSADDRLSVEVAPIHSDEIRTDVVQKVIAAIEAKVGQRIDELRHETFVSRAAWNAAFPR